MHRQGYDLQLTQYDERGWRATCYTTGIEHSPTSATGTAWERTPWYATQRAVWRAVRAGGRAGWGGSLPDMAARRARRASNRATPAPRVRQAGEGRRC